MMMKKIIAAAVMVPFIGACDMQIGSDVAEWNYTCSVDQMRRVESETMYCISVYTPTMTSAYIKGRCYNNAIIRNCERRLV